MAASAKCWLVKSEPDCFSIQDLAAAPRETTFWSGVRNYQARNFMRDEMRVGDRVLYYHSSADPPAIVGTAVVAREAYPDYTAWDHRDQHFDRKSTPENPIWYMVDLRLESIFAEPLPLERLRGVAALKQMELLRKGSRLSVQPVRPAEYEAVLAVAREGASGRGVKKANAAASKSIKSTKSAAAKPRAAARKKTSAAKPQAGRKSS